MPRDEEMLGITGSEEPDTEDMDDAEAIEDMADDMDLLREAAQGAPVEPPVMPRGPQVLPPTPQAQATAEAVAEGPPAALVARWIPVPGESKPRMIVRPRVDGQWQGKWHTPNPQEFEWVKRNGKMVRGGFADVPAATEADTPLWKKTWAQALAALVALYGAYWVYQHWDEVKAWFDGQDDVDEVA